MNALSSHLFYLGHNVLRNNLHVWVLILHAFWQEWNCIIEQYEVSFSDSSDQMFDYLECAESDHWALVASLHQNVVVKFLPHVVVVDSFHHLKHSGLQSILNEWVIQLAHVQSQSHYVGQGFRKLFEGIILQEGLSVVLEVQTQVSDCQSQQLEMRML